MKSLIVTIASISLLGSFTMLNADEEKGAGSGSPFSSAPEDPSNLLLEVDQRRAQRESLLPVSPLKPLHDASGEMKDSIYEASGIKLGLTINHLFQGLSEAKPGMNTWGTTTDADLVASWELINRGKPSAGKLFAHLEGRWDYGTTGPQDLGFVNLGSQIGTGNAFSKYQPTVLIRNLYWEQGSQEAGWAFRAGKITTDAILGTSKHITPVTTFLPNAGTGFFVDAFPDSGLGAVGAWHPSDSFKVIGLVADANGNRYDWGDIGAGDFYTALEVAAKIVPGTGRADYSKLTIWHTDGTEDGAPINANTGKDGWGYSLKYEQELSKDGRLIGITRWGQSFNEAALYKYQAGANVLLYEPLGSKAGMKNDLLGLGLNWVEPTAAGSRDEYNAEIFYRFPLFPGVDTTLSYQSVINPALNPSTDHASVFSLRFRTVF